MGGMGEIEVRNFTRLGSVKYAGPEKFKQVDGETGRT